MIPRHATIVSAAWGLTLVACAVPPTADFAARDSAGVRIAENAAPAGPLLHLDTIGFAEFGHDLAEGHEFITPTFAVRQPDGHLVAAGWAMTELQRFAPDGRSLGPVGRQGSGPGEFEALGFVFQTGGGRLITFEPGAQRLQRWSGDATFESPALLVSPEARPSATPIGAFDDGSLLLSVPVPDEDAGTEFLARFTTTLFHAPADGGTWDSLFSYPARPVIRHPTNPTWSYGTPLYSVGPSVTGRGDRIVYTPGDRFEVQVRDAGGRLQHIFRRAAPPRPISATEFERVFETVMEGIPTNLREPLRERYRRTSTSRVRPPVSGVWAIGDGGVLTTYGDSALGEPFRATILDPTGRWERDVELPWSFRILQVDADGLLGMTRDAEGFYRLRFYRIRLHGG